MALTSIRPRIGTVSTSRLTVAPKEADPFYLSTEWRRFIAAVVAERRTRLLARQGHLCEDPGCGASHTPTMRIFGDHIVELRDGGAAFDPANVMLRCGSSHSRKTYRERARRAASSMGGGGV